MKALTTLSLMLALSMPTFGTAQASEPGIDDGPACADGGHGPRGRHRGPPDPAQLQQHLTQRLERMTQELSLRPDQVTRIQAIFRDAVAQMQAHRPPASGAAQRPTPEQRRAHMQARFAVEERVAAVLDREQLLRWMAVRHGHMLEGRRGHRGAGAGPHGAGVGPRGAGHGRPAGGQGRR